jgi:hypothetical protein
MKNTQLTLVTDNPAWAISEQSKQIGRKGLAQAREAMRRAELSTQEAA